MKTPCRCLIGEMPDETELAAIIRERIDTIPEEERVTEEEYMSRLSGCRTCRHLQHGTCMLCGCYIEIRAAKKRQSCPSVPPEWI